jgi:hypothetical protein
VKRKPANRKPPKKRKPVDYLDVIASRLRDAEKRAKKTGVESFVLSPVRNSDRTIDGEVRFIRPHGEVTRPFVLDVEGWIVIPKGVWVSVGGRFEPTTTVMEHVTDPKTSRYEREQGLINIGAFFQRGRTKASVFLAARKFLEQMEETIKRRVLEVYVRLHYSPTDRQPERIGKPINKRRKPANRKPGKKGKKKNVSRKGKSSKAKRGSNAKHKRHGKRVRGKRGRKSRR